MKTIRLWLNHALFEIGMFAAHVETLYRAIVFILNHDCFGVPWFQIGWDLMERATDVGAKWDNRSVFNWNHKEGYMFMMYLEAGRALREAGWDDALIRRNRHRLLGKKTGEVCRSPCCS